MRKFFSKKVNSMFCITCNSGTIFIFNPNINIKKNDEIITTAHSWVSTSEVVKNFINVFVDTNLDFNIDENLIEKKNYKKNKSCNCSSFIWKTRTWIKF